MSTLETEVTIAFDNNKAVNLLGLTAFFCYQIAPEPGGRRNPHEKALVF